MNGTRGTRSLPISSGGGFLTTVGVVLVILFVWNVAIPFVAKVLSIGGHGDPPVPWSVPLPCVVESIDYWNSADTLCQERYIRWPDLESSLSFDQPNIGNGFAYAHTFLGTENGPPVVVIFPKQNASAERQRFHAVVRAAVIAMGETEKNVYTGQFASEGIRRTVEDAIAEADEIDQPTDETPQEQLRRLNLGPSILKLARDVASH